MLEYEIDNSKQSHFIDVMQRMLALSKELYPHIDVKYHFEWEDKLIKKVYYFFNFEDEHGYNAFFDLHQTDPKWLDFVINEYHAHSFVTPGTAIVHKLHEIGTQPIENIDLGGFDYDFNRETWEKVRIEK